MELTSEHFLALAVEDGHPRLKRLLPQEVGESNGDRVGRARPDGLRDGSRRRSSRGTSLALVWVTLLLARRTLRRALAGRSASLCLSLLLHLLHLLELGHALLTNVLDKFL